MRSPDFGLRSLGPALQSLDSVLLLCAFESRQPLGSMPLASSILNSCKTILRPRNSILNSVESIRFCEFQIVILKFSLQFGKVQVVRGEVKNVCDRIQLALLGIPSSIRRILNAISSILFAIWRVQDANLNGHCDNRSRRVL